MRRQGPMADGTIITIRGVAYDCADAVRYHHGLFPPPQPNLGRLLEPITQALIELTRYDTMLRDMLNSDILLAPLRAREAVVSSRMEGTISTLEEVLRLEADADEAGLAKGARDETVEVALYARALRQAERALAEGYPMSEHLIRTAHRTLLSHGRGAEARPGDYKAEQNYIGDRRRRRIEFVPIAPAHLPSGMEALVRFIGDGAVQPLLRTAIAHAEFEALHPFEDGNGRLGRMLITLMLWRSGILSAPRFFVSDYFERNKEEYIERLRAVSAMGAWTDWCAFFLEALRSQAAENIDVVGRIKAHHAEMRERFRDLLRSRWSADAADYIFANPIFRGNRFARGASIPRHSAYAFTSRLVDEGLLRIVIPPAGRSPGLYAFPSLLDIVREPR